jgi:hypothetical protein
MDNGLPIISTFHSNKCIKPIAQTKNKQTLFKPNLLVVDLMANASCAQCLPPPPLKTHFAVFSSYKTINYILMLINLANNNPPHFLDQWEVYMNQSHALDHGLFTSLAFLINPHVNARRN